MGDGRMLRKVVHSACETNNVNDPVHRRINEAWPGRVLEMKQRGGFMMKNANQPHPESVLMIILNPPAYGQPRAREKKGRLARKWRAVQYLPVPPLPTREKREEIHETDRPGRPDGTFDRAIYARDEDPPT
jgi:hypothetical protein